MTKGQEKAIIEVRKLRDVNKRNSLGKSIDTVLNFINELQKENKQKDKQIDLKNKQIDLMARAFRQDDVRSVEEIKEYFGKQAKEKGD